MNQSADEIIDSRIELEGSAKEQKDLRYLLTELMRTETGRAIITALPENPVQKLKISPHEMP